MKTPLLNDDLTAVVSIRSPWRTIKISSNSPSLYGHWSSNNPSLPIIETCKFVSGEVIGAGELCGDLRTLGFVHPSPIPSKTCSFLLSEQVRGACAFLCSASKLVLRLLPRFWASRFWIFWRSCFRYSTVSPKMEALSILVAEGTMDLRMRNLSSSFSQGARKWFPISSACDVPFCHWPSQDLDGLWRRCCFVWRKGMVSKMFLSKHWEVLVVLVWRSGRRVHLEKADWVEQVMLPTEDEIGHQLDWFRFRRAESVLE